ncbi:MAG TPA: LysE family transporter [Flavobacterium sp.]|jgi:threonine/homoserine/homoserine lactone efflux protein
MIQDILTAIPLGILLSFLIGPVFFVLLETSAVKGFRAALVFDLGVIIADIVFILIAYGSSYRLIMKIKNDPGIFIFGGILMMAYGVISFLKHRKAGRELRDAKDETVELIKKNYGNLFLKGFLLNFINIGVLFFWFMVLISIGPKLGLETSRMITFFGGVIGTYLTIDIIKILLAKQLKSKLTPINILKIKKGVSIVLVLFGIAIISQAWFPSDQKLVKKALEKME